ncbi:LysE family translocator [Brevundimonas diminuta]|jgi:threonine/homoserine/homoserine lactone efflux protein|uniref:Homoserine/homoserine lactone efflux protein n=2 Tax=Brevundimonas TaxID=41275 RepID=A0A1Z3LWV1_BREDI|nr:MULTISPECIES: LysE family translocator [Brevundimonas]OJU55125.1 MAG: threonine transporter RhtB [Brevundimonas sp. 67-6]ASD26616.1 LysE family translocator [Brevundimonas diminuta]MBD3571502.1 LysE family translocator [Brevundimonas diminuta]MBD3819267.1 LysE family translocator [Brevundimonas diminuta]MBI2249461.1 LysE family translocator [Brevundimonas diminuta]
MQPPIDPTVVAPFLVAVALMELTPGPNMGWLALVSLSQGRAAGLAAVVGITLGLTLWMVAAAFGLTEVVLRWPALYQAIRWAGVGFLLWLAWDAWRSAGDGAGVAPVAMRRRALFRRGLIGNLLNPKAALLYVVLLPGFMRPDHGSTLAQALTLGALHVLVSVVVHTTIVLTAARAGGALLTRAQGPMLRAAMALGLVAIAAWTAWETRA